MPNNTSVQVDDLHLDLGNFRTVPQPDELCAVQAMISISPDWFWALMDSLLQDGYLPTENIIVLREESGRLVVKEGNRRVAALKIAFGLIAAELPTATQHRINGLDADWKDSNKEVPCAIYGHQESAVVDRIVTLAHGKGEKAGRDHWNAVARSRHNKAVLGANEPALDLLEKYLQHGKNITVQQTERWAGDYPLTVLAEAIKRVAARFGATRGTDLASKYPSIQHRLALEQIMKDIGLQTIGFETIRNKKADFAASYGVPAASTGGVAAATGAAGSPTGAGGTSSPISAPVTTASSSGANSSSTTVGSGAQSNAKATPGKSGRKISAVGADDPRSVKRALKKLRLVGNSRTKVVTLCAEAERLDLKNNPIAFCFLLRSMFEISAKAYCDDHAAQGGPSATNAKGDRVLVDVLWDITTHLTKNNTDKAKVRLLHGAMTELAKPEGILSVTSMNQLVHNPRFLLSPPDICLVFGNILPLLEEMNG